MNLEQFAGKVPGAPSFAFLSYAKGGRFRFNSIATQTGAIRHELNCNQHFP